MGVDVSSRMLEFAAENLKRYGNVVLRAGDFKNPDAAMEALLSSGFDLVFAAMSPAVEDLESLRIIGPPTILDMVKNPASGSAMRRARARRPW